MADGGVGEAALLGEIAPEIGASIPGFVGGNPAIIDALGTALPGMETAGLSSLGQTYGSMSGALGNAAFGTVTPTLASAAPEAAAQTTAALTSAGAPAAQTAQEAISNQIISKPVSQMGTGQFTDSLANAAARGDPLGVSSGVLGTYPPGTSDIVGGGVPMPAAASTANGLSDLVSKFHNLPVEKQMLYGGAGLLGANALFGPKAGGVPAQQKYSGPLSKFHYDPAYYTPTTAQQPTPYYQPTYQHYADGGMMDAGANPGMQMQGGNDPLAFQSTGVERFADGGISNLGGYSDGGRMLKGPGDGMSDDIPATIADKQPARLANDEFVVPADVVSHLGNGSSDAGAKQLYKMMDRVRQARTGNKAQGKQINPTKYTPA